MSTSNFDKQRLADYGIDSRRLARLYERIDADIAAGKYPGAAVAIARRGLVLAEKAFGVARLAEDGKGEELANTKTLWLLYSQTKPITSCAIWILIERGLLNLHAPVALYLPAFAAHNKEQITVFHLLTHQAGFPDANVPSQAWGDKKLLYDSVCGFIPDFSAGAKVFYHSFAAHWVQAVLIEAVTGMDFRDFIRSRNYCAARFAKYFYWCAGLGTRPSGRFL